MKIIDDKIAENNFQINNLKQLVDKELNTIKHFLNSMPSKTNNNIVSDLKDEINFLKNELASKNKIIEILHENSLRCNDISTQQNFKNIDEFQTIRTSSQQMNSRHQLLTDINVLIQQTTSFLVLTTRKLTIMIIIENQPQFKLHLIKEMTSEKDLYLYQITMKKINRISERVNNHQKLTVKQ